MTLSDRGPISTMFTVFASGIGVARPQSTAHFQPHTRNKCWIHAAWGNEFTSGSTPCYTFVLLCLIPQFRIIVRSKYEAENLPTIRPRAMNSQTTNRCIQRTSDIPDLRENIGIGPSIAVRINKTNKSQHTAVAQIARRARRHDASARLCECPTGGGEQRSADGQSADRRERRVDDLPIEVGHPVGLAWRDDQVFCAV